MRVELRSDHRGGAELAKRMRTLARAHLVALDRLDASLSVLLTSDRVIRGLNRRWRGVDQVTDVLSFPLDEGAELGDVVISVDMARRRARGAGRPLLAEVDRYLVHGILHLLGHDHERPSQARAMALLEDELLGRAGMLGESLAPPTRARRREPGRLPRRARGDGVVPPSSPASGERGPDSRPRERRLRLRRRPGAPAGSSGRSGAGKLPRGPGSALAGAKPLH